MGLGWRVGGVEEMSGFGLACGVCGRQPHIFV